MTVKVRDNTAELKKKKNQPPSSSLTSASFPPPPSVSSPTASPDSISLQQALHESVFSPGISTSPHHRVALCWDKHCQLLPEVVGLNAQKVAAWNAEEVSWAPSHSLQTFPSVA